MSLKCTLCRGWAGVDGRNEGGGGFLVLRWALLDGAGKVRKKVQNVSQSVLKRETKQKN